MQKQSKTLVLAAGSLGDCIVILPALQHLQSQNDLTVAGTFPYRELGASLLGVNEVVSLDPVLQSLYDPAGEDSMDPEFLKSFGDIYLFFKDSDARLSDALSRHSNVKVHQPAHSFEDFMKEGRWAGEYWLRAALPPGETLEQFSKHHHLKISQQLRTQGKSICDSLQVSNPFIIHPGSGSPSKNAPLSFFKNAAEKTVAESKKPVIVLWGEAEMNWLGEIKKVFEAIPGVKLVPQPLALPEVVALFTQACGYLGNDSGITQLASACGAKTFAVFNTTDSRVWGPQEAIILDATRSLYSPQ
jgi:ADP-heptose:LPS heptosyltransferase